MAVTNCIVLDLKGGLDEITGIKFGGEIEVFDDSGDWFDKLNDDGVSA